MTEWTAIDKGSTEWRKTRKLGALLGDKEDAERRVNLAMAMFNQLERIWRQHKVISQELRVQLFRTYVEPHFTYACGTWGQTEQQLRWVEAQHRALLRKAINIRYPQRIRNRALYEVTGVPPLGVTIAKARWSLFGQVLRLDRKAPAQTAMDLYVTPPGKAGRGRPATTLPVHLHQELKDILPEVLDTKQLKFTAATLDKLRSMANKVEHTNKNTIVYPQWEVLIQKAMTREASMYGASIGKRVKRKRQKGC